MRAGRCTAADEQAARPDRGCARGSGRHACSGAQLQDRIGAPAKDDVAGSAQRDRDPARPGPPNTPRTNNPRPSAPKPRAVASTKRSLRSGLVIRTTAFSSIPPRANASVSSQAASRRASADRRARRPAPSRPRGDDQAQGADRQRNCREEHASRWWERALLSSAGQPAHDPQGSYSGFTSPGIELLATFGRVASPGSIRLLYGLPKGVGGGVWLAG